MKALINEYRISENEDQLSQTTRAIRRNLLIVSSLVILLTTEKITIQPTFGLDLSSPEAKGAIAIVVLYKLITFLVCFTIDYRSWNAKKKITKHTFKEKNIANYLTNLTLLDQSIQFANEPISSNNTEKTLLKKHSLKIASLIQSSQERTEQYNSELQKFSKSIENTNILQSIRIWILDLCLPVAVALPALYRSVGDISVFLKALFC